MLQFAYQAGRGIDAAKVFMLNTNTEHLAMADTAARLLNADFSSAFNSMQPQSLPEKLITCFHVDHQLTLWIVNFTNRSQRGLVSNRVTSYTAPLAPYRAASSLVSHLQVCPVCSQATRCSAGPRRVVWKLMLLAQHK